MCVHATTPVRLPRILVDTPGRSEAPIVPLSLEIHAERLAVDVHDFVAARRDDHAPASAVVSLPMTALVGVTGE